MVPDDVLVETDCDGGVLGTCNPSELKRAVRVTICDTSNPPAPVDVTVVRCGNTTEDILSEDSPAQQVVISGSTQPIPVCIEGEKDFAEVYKCDANTGNTVLIRTVLDHDTGAFVTTYFDLVLGAVWAGNPATDLTECQDNNLESDKVILCDDNGQFYRWFVKDNGQPTGLTFDTTLSGSAYTTVGTVVECSLSQQVLADHQNGCIERTTPVIPPSCNTSTQTFNFATGDLIGVTKIFEDGNGNFTLVQETTPAMQPALLSVLQLASVSNNRTLESVNSGAAIFNFWSGNFSNVISLSATEVQFDYHAEVGVSDIPTALTAPCVDSIPDTDYINSAAILNGFYSGLTLNVQEPNGAATIDFTITTYTATQESGGIEHIPAKQVVTYDINGNPSTDRYFEQSTLTEIIFDTNTDVFNNTCIIPTPEASTPVQVCVVEEDTIALELTGSVLGSVVTVNPDTTGSTETITTTVIDWGLGVVSYNTPLFYDYSTTPDGQYLIQVQVKDNNNASLISVIQVTVTGGIPTLGSVPTPKLTTYETIVKKVFRSFDGTGAVLWTVDENGVPYTAGVGQIIKPCGDCDCSNKPCESFCFSSSSNTQNSDIVQCNTTVGGVAREATNAELDQALIPLGGVGVPHTYWHPQLGNTISMLGIANDGVMLSGIGVDVSSPITGAVFTYNLNITSDADIGDPADLGVVVIDNATGNTITATSIVTGLVFSNDVVGTGNDYPIYAGGVGAATITWTGDLPIGSYSVVYLHQDQSSGVDSVDVEIVPTLPSITSTTNAQLVALDQCTIDALTSEPTPPIEVPNGAIITNTAAIPVIAGTSSVVSIAVKPLNNTNYDISFDNGATWLTDIDGTDSYGEGTVELLDITNTLVRPTVSGDRVYIHWEVA